MDRRVVSGIVIAGVAGAVAAVVLSPRLRQGARQTLALPGPAPDSLKSAALTSAEKLVHDGLSQASSWLASQKSVQSSAKSVDESGAGHA